MTLAVNCKRIISRGVLLALVRFGIAGGLASGCVDAPITPDQLEADGHLRSTPALGQGAFSATPRPQPQQAAQISAVLAAQAAGPLEDASRFPADVGAVNLHLRADGLSEARSVVFRWTHEGKSVLQPGRLETGGTLALASSFPIEGEQTGTWQVEVLAEAGPNLPEPVLLFERSFEIYAPAEPSEVPSPE